MRPYIGPIARIQGTVASYYHLKYDDMFSPVREVYYSHPRQVAMYLAREITRKPLTEIGLRFRRDHSTVIHAIKAVSQRCEIHQWLRDDLAKLRARIAQDIADQEAETHQFLLTDVSSSFAESELVKTPS